MSGRRSPARIATLIAGGIVAVGAVAAAGFGGAAALAQPDYGRMQVAIPDDVTAITIETRYTNVDVYGGQSLASGTASAAYWTQGTTILGPLPQVSVQIEGTQARVTVQDEERELAWGVGMGTLQVLLSPALHLESLTIDSGGYVNVETPGADRIDITANSGTGIGLDQAAADVTLHGTGRFEVTTATQPWHIVKPGWFDAYVAQWWTEQSQVCYGRADGLQACVQATDPSNWCSLPPGSAPGVCVASDDAASRTIDLSQVAPGSSVEIRPTTPS